MMINSDRRHRGGIPFLLLGAALLLCLLSFACREYEMKSGWLDRDVRIDGETGADSPAGNDDLVWSGKITRTVGTSLPAGDGGPTQRDG
ncbi:MAG: hypothetical protein KJ874_10540 [Acidobacteria bacterium]|nr:hypothetical protein [Acidobacteriota bacterium]